MTDEATDQPKEDILVPATLEWPIMFRVEPNLDARIIVPGRRAPEVLRMWFTGPGLKMFVKSLIAQAIDLPGEPDVVAGISLHALRMQQGHEPKIEAMDPAMVERRG